MVVHIFSHYNDHCNDHHTMMVTMSCRGVLRPRKGRIYAAAGGGGGGGRHAFANASPSTLATQRCHVSSQSSSSPITIIVIVIITIIIHHIAIVIIAGSYIGRAPCAIIQCISSSLAFCNLILYQLVEIIFHHHIALRDHVRSNAFIFVLNTYSTIISFAHALSS